MFKILNNEELNDENELSNKERRFKPKYLVNIVEKEENGQNSY